jgi:lysozyme
MKISPTNLAVLMKDEGVRLKAYQDSGGVWTIGFGHTHDVKGGDVITLQQAYAFLYDDMKTVETWINRQQLTLNQNQFDALADFIFNCGPGHFIQWGLLAMIRKNPNNKEIGDEMKEHVHDMKGKELPGLVKRRAKEVELYFKSI